MKVAALTQLLMGLPPGADVEVEPVAPTAPEGLLRIKDIPGRAPIAVVALRTGAS